MTVTPSELQDRVERVIRERQRAIVLDLGQHRTLWLAAPPLWTRSAAETTGFPVEPDESVTDFVRRASAAGWCKTRGSLRADGPTELRFWMPDELRRDVLDIVRELVGGDLQAVQNDAREVASSVVRHADEVDLPGPLQAWAELCAEVEPDRIPARLLNSVKEAVEAHDLGRAQELVTAGKALEAVVEGTADSQLTRARLLLDGGLERHTDKVALGRYLDRPELSDAVVRLLAPDASKWALHLRGVGGVGKSMFIRYLTSGRFAEDRKLRPIPMACVNFDHVNPDYPVRKPVQLLLELADELALHAAYNDQAYQALRSFYDQADSAHQGLSSLRDGSLRPLDDDLAVRNAVDAFARVIDELGGALLILDTCEELAKWNPGNLNSPAILATLEMVERLHGQVDSARVLLAGRRPLPVRGWLDERIVAGFTVAEARQYLALPGDRELPADLADEIIRQSRAIDEPVPDPGQLPTWVNPFDLALYRAWANEEPGLSVADIARGNDAYVESRIIQRLDDPLVKRALPMLAAGGKCRVETIATALDCDAASLGSQLAAQEWIEAEGGVPPVFVTAWPSMAERLRRYYDTADHLVEFSRAMRRFAKVIRRRLGDHPDAPIEVDEVIVALRWAEPAEAAGLWDLITAQAALPPGRWGTVSAITLRILGLWYDEAEWPTAGALRAAVLAAHIAAHRRKMPLADVREWWGQVLARASEHPDSARQSQLRVLGALGVLPYAPDEASLWDVLRAEQGSLMSSPEVGTAAIDALHRLLEAGHADGARQLQELLDLESFRSAFQGRPEFGRALPPSDADRPMAWARVAEARLLADSDPSAARERLADAERLASAAAGAEWAWPHWVPPEDLLARVRIERGLIDRKLFAVSSGLTLLDTWEDYAARHLRSIDGERLASLCLRLRLRHGAMPAAVAEWWESADTYVRGRTATNSAHDLVPPLFVSVAEAWLSAAQPERALALLDRRRSEANMTLDDDATVRHADAGTVALARRLRLADQRSLLARLTAPAEYRSAARSRIATLDNARRAWAVIYREAPPDAHFATDRLTGWHAWWQCQTAEVSNLVPQVPWSSESPDADQVGLGDIQADLMEMRSLGRHDLEQVRVQLNAFLNRHEQASRHPLAPVRSSDPYQDLRPDLRWPALDEMRYAPPSGEPVRLIAEMAFEEAELLSLRLPAAAAQVYWVAANAYARCGDHVGRLLALVAFHDALSECSEGNRSSLFGRLPVGSAAAKAFLLNAWEAIVAGQPELATILAGPPEDAGAWRYWTEAVQRNIGNLSLVVQAATRASPVTPVAAPEPTASARDAKEAMVIRRVLFRVLALPLAMVLFGRIRTAFRLAAERGIGAVRIETLTFEATIGGAAPDEPSDAVRLQVRLLPWRSAPVRSWSRLRLRAMILALRLLRCGWPGRPPGYSGSLEPGAASSDTGGLSWTPRLDSSPDTWWERRSETPVSGTIRTGRIQAGRPWERILASSLGPAADGRIEWIRLAADQVRAVDSGGLGVELVAAPVRDRPLAGSASSHGPGPRVRHVIGRAVRTSAGPFMNVSGESRLGRGVTLLAVKDLTRRHPMVVVLQAEPADEHSAGTIRHYDLEDKIRLAMALLDDGVPAVLILPVLPALLAREVAQLVTAFADAADGSGQDVRATLLRPLRAAIMRDVEPAALDDVILFLNARYA